MDEKIKETNDTEQKDFNLQKAEKECLTLISGLNRPVRKTELICFMSKTMKLGTAKQILFAIDECIERGTLYENNGCVYVGDYLPEEHPNPDTYDTALVKYLPILYEEAKDYYDNDNINASLLIDYIEHVHPGLMNESPAYDFMQWISTMLPEYYLSNQFFVELNDYDFYESWFKTFFNHSDCRIKLKDITYKKGTIYIGVYLIPGKKGSFKKAHHEYLKLKEHIAQYFNVENIRINTTLMKNYKKNKENNYGK